MKHITVRAVAGAKAEEIIDSGAGRLRIHVREPAEDGRANERIIQILRERFPGEAVKLVKGGQSPSKIFQIG